MHFYEQCSCKGFDASGLMAALLSQDVCPKCMTAILTEVMTIMHSVDSTNTKTYPIPHVVVTPNFYKKYMGEIQAGRF